MHFFFVNSKIIWGKREKKRKRKTVELYNWRKDFALMFSAVQINSIPDTNSKDIQFKIQKIMNDIKWINSWIDIEFKKKKEVDLVAEGKWSEIVAKAPAPILWEWWPVKGASKILFL